MKVLICGFRYFDNYDKFKAAMFKIFEEWNLIDYSKDLVKADVIMIHGDCKGTDSLADKFADEFNLKKEIYKADWNTYGKAAGPIRNSLMVDACDYCIAFPSKSGSGTQDTIRKARNKLGNQKVKVLYVD